MEKKEVVVEEAVPPLPIRTRLILCVDGARYDVNNPAETPTTIYRIYSSLKRGKCTETQTSISYNQIPRYFPTVTGVADGVFSKERIQATLPGHGYHQQIQDVYEACCKLTGPQDEVVFFGFARGAYVVRAVAGLLHCFGSLTSAGSPEFARSYRKVLKETDKATARSGSLALSKSSSVSSVSTASSGDFRSPPTIKFVGAFDTIKAVNDDAALDINFNSSIRHLRHAIALHEDRKALSPEYVYPEELYGTELRKQARSEVQAWFIGNHDDVGGASPKSGLGLYPAQWMIFEANTCGVAFDYEDKSLSVIFPKEDRAGKAAATSTFQAANHVIVTMQDLRQVHDAQQPFLQGNYSIKLGTRQGTMRQKKTRSPFDKNGYLQGYCDYAPQGTIIHPSVYLLLDEHINVALDTKEAKLQRHLEQWREKMLGSQNGVVNFGFWGGEDDNSALDSGAIRVLVCGNTGVGKSTLINKTFGVNVTQSSDRSRGIHDVKQEITFEGRPDLIVHDSGGFEAGAEAEFQAIEDFLKEKSSVMDVKDRLHVIW